MRRRACLGALAGLAAPAARAAVPGTAPPTGWVRPRPEAPDTPLACASGGPRGLRQCLRGAVSAVQLIFTGCNGSCPLQGALFARIAEVLPPSGVRLLSISIDALGDTPATLRDWQRRWGPTPGGWLAAVPPPGAVDALAGFLRGVDARAGTHTAQVFVFDRDARLCYRTGDDPEPAFVRALLAHVAQER